MKHPLRYAKWEHRNKSDERGGGGNRKTKESQIKFSECIWLGAPGINLDADTSSSTTSPQNEEKWPRHEQAEGSTSYRTYPPPPAGQPQFCHSMTRVT
jgi:hypothetical protein